MGVPEVVCQCGCGAQEFHLRLKKDEQVGLLTCIANHHSLLLDTRDYWADALQEGRPPRSRCGCGSTLFHIKLVYELREDGDVRAVTVQPTCARCRRTQRVMAVDIKYSPTEQLITKPLDPIELPWLQPRRRQITALWLPLDAERFVRHLVQSHAARIFTSTGALEFVECQIDDVQFLPELRRQLLFSNLPDVPAPSGREPQRYGPFLRLSSPYHIGYSPHLQNHHLLHYINYSKDLLNRGRLEMQPPVFLRFAKEACDWLLDTYVSDRGSNTADNLQEWLRAKPHLRRQGGS